jgi:flagellar biosynthesis protein
MKNDNSQNEIAIALQYDGRNAPKVTAKGYDDMAAKIIEIAKQNDVPIQYQPILAEVLSHIELGEEIPEALYVAVAEIIIFAYILAGKISAIPTLERK